MADPFGISFSPTDQNGPTGQPGTNRPSPIQQAIQTLSFKIPRVAGASAFTAQPLLTSPGGSGLGGNPNSAAILEQIRRMLFGDMSGASGQPAGGGSSPFNPGPDLSQILGAPSPSAPQGAPAPRDRNPQGVPVPNFEPGNTPPRDPDPGMPAPPMPPAASPMPTYTPPEARDRRL